MEIFLHFTRSGNIFLKVSRLRVVVVFCMVSAPGTIRSFSGDCMRCTLSMHSKDCGNAKYILNESWLMFQIPI